MVRAWGRISCVNDLAFLPANAGRVSLFLCAALAGRAQIPADTLLRDSLTPVTITAARLPAPALRLPYAVGVLHHNQIQRGQMQLSLHESLVALPGVHALNPANFAQDLRLSVRGFGARSAFGIRGLRLFVDGLPESTPDGQADVDNLDPGALQSLELLRGASAGLYGNAAGGVLNLRTEEPGALPFGEVRATTGSFGFRRLQAKGSLSKGKTGLSGALAHNRIGGYRDQSAMRQSILNLKVRLQLNASTRLSLLVNAGSSPLAQDAGGLTAGQVSADRRQARDANVRFDAGETVAQGRIGTVMEKSWTNKHELTVKGYITGRDFANRLAFQNGAWVEFNRLFGGAAVQYTFRGPSYRSQIGLETNHQRDHRYRFDNLEGEKGPLRLEQNERFHSTGLFWVQEWTPEPKWILNASTRFDQMDLQAEDLFLADGNQSGKRSFQRFSPMLGIVFLPSSAFSLYANLASHFEAPTLTELSSNPSNLGGFNSDVAPQTSLHGEIGLKTAGNKQAGLELAAFYIVLRDELTPYQLADFPGRVFYRNAGQSRRLGLEAFFQWTPVKGVKLSAGYTFSDFRYKDYEANGVRYDGLRAPGIPAHQGTGSFQWTAASGFFCSLQWRALSLQYADDANTALEPGYALVNARAGYTVSGKSMDIEPFAGANNLLGAAYSGNILLNAAGSRYFEPDAELPFIFAGIRVRAAPKRKE